MLLKYFKGILPTFVTFGSTDRVDHDGVSAVTRCIVRVGWTETEVIQVEKL